MGHASGLPDLIAVQRDAGCARRTIERLSRAGIDGGAIEMLRTTEVVTAGRYGDRQTDLGSTLHLGGRVLRGAAWGSVPGAGFGALLLGLATSPTIEVLAAGAGGGALFGASVGALTGLLTVPSMVTSWERTFAPQVPGELLIGVRVDDARTGRRARRALASTDTTSVHEVRDLDETAAGSLGADPDPDPPAG